MLTLDKDIYGKTIALQLKGDIDIEATETFHNELFPLIKDAYSSYEISMKEVEFVDSTGIGLVLHLIEYIKTLGSLLKIVDIRQEVYDVFSILQIEEIVGKEVFKNIEII
ncbi:STAS domain-containing protein [Fictibacillus enclensis]|uniref:STAS domain-containing protein n=1 Tax=Fictibacillus enclensis TaxID=1017270 RepID=UPI0025A2B8CC|nr:STAS domain-containing protein [Fictibacillus enclensis]MDM5335749.1 STAS domain-containing protein [Fictibacillus enclensis]